MECQCCYTSLEFHESTYCSGDTLHFFCFDCATQNVKTSLEKYKTTFLCMHSSGCKSEFEFTELVKFLDSKMLDSIYIIKTKNELNSANIESLIECPSCCFSFIYDDTNNIVQCPNQICLKNICKLCMSEHSLYEECNDITKDHMEEERKTKEFVVTCPKCNVEIIKENGCNKIQCTCGTQICYQCRQDISSISYGHFDFTENSCKLFNNYQSF